MESGKWKVDPSGNKFATAKGAKVGDTERRIKLLYGPRVDSEKHFYTDGKYLTITQGRFSIIFQIDKKGRVVNISDGKLPEVVLSKAVPEP